MSATRRPLEAAGKLHTRVVELTALCAELERARQSAEAALLAKSAEYDALVAEIARAPVGKVEVYDTPEQWHYVIVPDHFDSGSRVRLLLVREGGDGK